MSVLLPCTVLRALNRGLHPDRIWGEHISTSSPIDVITCRETNPRKTVWQTERTARNNAGWFGCFEELRSDSTWSWTSSSQSSSCMMCSKGLNSASLKWKCGSSAQLVSTSVRTSWIKETAFWDTWRSLWHAACDDDKNFVFKEPQIKAFILSVPEVYRAKKKENHCARQKVVYTDVKW